MKKKKKQLSDFDLPHDSKYVIRMNLKNHIRISMFSRWHLNEEENKEISSECYSEFIRTLPICSLYGGWSRISWSRTAAGRLPTIVKVYSIDRLEKNEWHFTITPT